MAARATLLHADLDAFYASVEQLLDPGLRDRPIAVGGGVVLAASYEAKAFGVRGGMPGHMARRLCPDLLFVSGHFSEYRDFADRVFAVCEDFTPVVERISIDEAFLDVSGSTHLFGPAAGIAAEIRRRVRDEIGLPLSVGVASTKHLAKIASQVAKPDGLVVVEPGEETAFLHPLPVGLIWGIGPVGRDRLAAEGITTIGDLAALSPERMERLFGVAAGTKLGALARNDDGRRVEARRRARSVSAQAATGRRVPEEEFVARTVRHLADRVTTRLRAKQRAGRTITARVRFADLRSVSRSLTLPEPTSSTATVADVARGLVAAALRDHPQEREITLLAVAVSSLMSEHEAQPELALSPDAARATAKAGHQDLERALDRVRQRFGGEAVGYASVALSAARVPDAFRELAERRL